MQGIELVRGWPLTELEQNDFLHLWAVIGHAIGIEDRFNPCLHGVDRAHAILESILMVWDAHFYVIYMVSGTLTTASCPAAAST